MEKYDIFLSYRRDGGRDVARPIKLELEKHGYNVFLDFDELKDGSFNQKIKDAISEAPIFIVILSSHALDRCINEDDWVRQEIEYAIIQRRHIIPINPDLTFEGFPKNLPQHIKDGLGCHQYSDILFGQLFEDSIRKMVRERIVPYVPVPRKKQRKTMLYGIILALTILLVGCLVLRECQSHTTDVSNLSHFIVNGTDFEMVYVEGGNFVMGADSLFREAESDEIPAHVVSVGNFYIGKYEITQEQYEAVKGNNPSHNKGKGALPVENVNYYEAIGFIRSLNDLTGLEFDLPTEAEWEYAAGGGRLHKGYRYSGSDNPEDVAWYVNNANGRTKPVGKKRPNELGIYDMSGNVWEWCKDYYDSTYYRTMYDFTNPQGAKLSSHRTIRGSSVQLPYIWCRSTNRDGQDPAAKDTDYGFRIILRVK